MIELGPCEITGVYGPMASGKTYLINQWLKTQNRYVRFDVTGESCDDPSVEHVWASPAKLWRRLKENPFYFRIAYHPGPNLEEDFLFAVKCVWRLKNVFKLLVCDELHEVCSVNSTPGYVKTLMRYARHGQTSLIGASQRIADVSKLFTSGSRQTIIYWTQEATDLEAVEKRWGTDAANAVANLRPLIYDDVRKVTLQIPQALVIPKSGTKRIYDFKLDNFVGTVGERPSYQDAPQEIPEPQDSESSNPEVSSEPEPIPGVENNAG